MVFTTFKYRMKDGAASTRWALRTQARSVNFVWNYCCQIDREARSRWKAGRTNRRPSAFDLTNLCRGVTKDLGLHSDCIDAVCAKFAIARNATFPRTPGFRSAKRNLDWIPVSNFKRPAKLIGTNLTFLGRRYTLWLSRPLPDSGRASTWSFSADARGRWYVNIQVELPDGAPVDGEAIGIDLGLKTLATLSNGEKIEMPGFYRQAEEQLAKLQRFGMKRRARSLSAKVANQRRDFLHKATTDLAGRFAQIVVGDVSPAKLKRTRMAKSVSDAGWAMFKSMLRYKAIARGAAMMERRYTSHTRPLGLGSPKPRDSIGDLCVALRHRWNPNELFVIFTAYFDESDTHGPAPTMIMAAHFGHAYQWRRFETKLAHIQKRDGFTVFHAKDFMHGSGEFAGWSESKCRRLIADLTDLVGNGLAGGVTVHLEHDRYMNEYRAPPIPRKMRLDSQYGVCFRACLGHVLHHLAERGNRDRLNVIMESGHRSVWDCERIFSDFKRQWALGGVEVLGAFSVETKGSCNPLMVADMLAGAHKLLREAMSREEFSYAEIGTEAPRSKGALAFIQLQEGALADLKRSFEELRLWELAQHRARRGARREASAERPS